MNPSKEQSAHPPADPPPPYYGPQTQGMPPSGPYQNLGGENIPVTTVVMGPQFAGQVPAGVTVINVAKWGPHPMTVHCPNCQNQIITSTSVTPGLLTYLLSGALIVFGCFWGCCLIPCCIPECQDVEHACPNCKQHLGTFRRM